LRLIVDNALSPRIATALAEAGHDAIHVRDRGLRDASDDEIVDFATNDSRIIVSADTDFAEILARRAGAGPSFVLLRHAPATVDLQILTLVANLPRIEQELASGAVAVIEPGRIRIRSLPIGAE